MVFAGTACCHHRASGSIYYYHADHLGSSSVITDSVGPKVQAVTYFPYGGTRTNNSTATPAIDVAYKYTGGSSIVARTSTTTRPATTILRSDVFECGYARG